MAEAITAEKDGAKSVEPRRLSPGLAFLGGLIGIGYLYVGRIGYEIVFVVVPYVLLFVAAWARVVAEPVGWYASIAVLGLVRLVPIIHPVVLAWSRPLAPAKPYNRWWWYLAWLAGFGAVQLLLDPATTFGYQSYYIPSGAMQPTVLPGDRVVVDTWRYRDLAPAFGDIVICDLGEVKGVKRVVGVPGDTIELRGPLLIRNGAIVNEPYLSSERAPSPLDRPPLTLAADQFFVLGDNRGNSNDSRFVGPIGRDQIFGRVEFVAYSRSPGRFALVLTSD
jgi:signal peptidase I